MYTNINEGKLRIIYRPLKKSVKFLNINLVKR